MNAIRDRGEEALVEFGVKFGDLPDKNAEYVLGRDKLKEAWEGGMHAFQVAG